MLFTAVFKSYSQNMNVHIVCATCARFWLFWSRFSDQVNVTTGFRARSYHIVFYACLGGRSVRKGDKRKTHRLVIVLFFCSPTLRWSERRRSPLSVVTLMNLVLAGCRTMQTTVSCRTIGTSNGRVLARMAAPVNAVSGNSVMDDFVWTWYFIVDVPLPKEANKQGGGGGEMF